MEKEFTIRDFMAGLAIVLMVAALLANCTKRYFAQQDDSNVSPPARLQETNSPLSGKDKQ